MGSKKVKEGLQKMKNKLRERKMHKYCWVVLRPSRINGDHEFVKATIWEIPLFSLAALSVPSVGQVVLNLWCCLNMWIFKLSKVEAQPGMGTENMGSYGNGWSEGSQNTTELEEKVKWEVNWGKWGDDRWRASRVQRHHWSKNVGGLGV